MFNFSHKILKYFLSCLIVGVALRSFLAVDFLPFLIVGLTGLILVFRNKTFGILVVGALFIGLGILRYQLSLPVSDETKVWFHNGNHLSFQALVVKDPDVRVNNTKLTVEALGEVTGRVLLTVSLYPEFFYGDLLKIDCNLKSPQVFDGFRYDRYLAKDRIYSVCYHPKISLVSRHSGDLLFEHIFSLKQKLKNLINANLPEPQASLLSAIMLGNRRGIPDELSQNFSLTGTSHLIAISGLHITILSFLLLNLFINLYLSRAKSFWLLTLLLFLYLALIGFPASAVRASIMGWLAILAMNFGRVNQSVNALLFAASLMLLVNPKIFRDDVGFQLSFCAVLGLIYFFPLIEEKLKLVPNYLNFRDSLAMTLSAQLATMPLIVFYFGQMSLIAPLVNLLVLPVLPVLMITGLVAVIGGLIFGLAAPYFFWPVLFLLNYFMLVIDFFSKFPFASLKL